MHELALFAGGGGGILGGFLLGWRTVCAVELDPYARSVLLARQRDGILPRFPIWDDVRTFDGTPWRGHVDVISGGFPCQDISSAGRGAGITGARSGLWKEFARIVGEVGPRFVLVENSPVLTSRGLGVVLGDLATLGYDARWGVLGAADAIWDLGTPCLDHLRERIWIAATDADCVRELQPQGRLCDIGRWVGDGDQATAIGASNGRRSRRARGFDSGSPREREQALQADANREGVRSGPRLRQARPLGNGHQSPDGGSTGGGVGHWWESEPAVGRVAHGVAHRVDRLRAIGNGQVPAVVRLAWETLAP